MNKANFTKSTVMDYLWQYSHFYSDRLQECEEFFYQEKGYAAVTLLFANLENVAKSIVNDFDSSFYHINKKIKNLSILTESEYNFINGDTYSIRRIRNIYAHANLSAIFLLNNENGREILYPLTEEDSCLLLYDKISLIIFNIILKMVSSEFIEDVQQRLKINMDNKIKECEIKIMTLSVKELLRLKGIPDDYFSDDLDIPEDAKIRLIENAPDVNVLTHFLKNIE